MVFSIKLKYKSEIICFQKNWYNENDNPALLSKMSNFCFFLSFCFNIQSISRFTYKYKYFQGGILKTVQISNKSVFVLKLTFVERKHVK